MFFLSRSCAFQNALAELLYHSILLPFPGHLQTRKPYQVWKCPQILCESGMRTPGILMPLSHFLKPSKNLLHSGILKIEHTLCSSGNWRKRRGPTTGKPGEPYRRRQPLAWAGAPKFVFGAFFVGIRERKAEYSMLNQKIALHTAGPTPVPPQVNAAMVIPMINHRSDTFSRLYRDVAQKLQTIFQTKEQIYVLAGTGSSGWEAAMVNFVPTGAKVLNVVIGDFGERWAKANAALGFQVERLDYPVGTSAKTADVAALLKKHEGSIQAVCLQHNETSTGVYNPVQEIAAEVKKHGALVLVDAVSSLGAMPLAMDEWGLDVVFTGSQKALMCPPGLMIIAASQQAWSTAEQATTPRFFFDLKGYRRDFEKGQTPHTPAVSLYFGLQEALNMLAEEGLQQTYQRHHLMGTMCRAGIKAAGLELLCEDEQFASATLTAVKLPQGVDAATFRKAALKTFGVVLAAGQGSVMKDLIFRIGHMGYMTPNDVLLALATVENSLAYTGYPIEVGKAVAAAQKTWLQQLTKDK